MREIDITEQNIYCCDIYIDSDNINCQYELWFDVDKYFGTNVNDTDESIYINFYTFWTPDNEIKAVYEVYTEDRIDSFDWNLTDKEKKFFLDKMEQYCQKRNGKTLIELWEEYCEE